MRGEWRVLVAGLLIWLGGGFFPCRAMEVISPNRALSNLEKSWEVFRQALKKEGLTEEAKTALHEVVESKWDGDLGDLPLQAMALLRWAEEFEGRGDTESSFFLLDHAEKLAGSSTRVQLALARYYLGGGRFDLGRALIHYQKAFRAGREDLGFLTRLFSLLSLLPLIFLGIFGISFVLLSVAKYFPLLVHEVSDFFPPGKLPSGVAWGLALLLLLLPLAGGFSLFWVLGWGLVIFSLFMSRGEQAMVAVWILVFALAPWYMDKEAKLFSARADAALQAGLRVRNSVPLPGDSQILQSALEEEPNDAFLLFSLAQLQQRQGRLSEAANNYSKLFENPRALQAAYNNIAQIYFVAGDEKSASQALFRAEEEKPARLEIIFNLGQFYQQVGKTEERDDFFAQAEKLDKARFQELLSRFTATSQNRVMATLPAPKSLFWARVFREDPNRRMMEQGWWNLWLGPPTGIGFWAGSALLLLAWAVITLRKSHWTLAYRCASCGQPICRRCQEPSKDPRICSTCYHVFREAGGLDLKVKMEKRASVQFYRDLWRRSAAGLSLLLPGSGPVLLGNSGAGFSLLTLSSLVLAIWVSPHYLWPEAGPNYAGGLGLETVLLAAVYVVLMVISFFLYRSESYTWR